MARTLAEGEYVISPHAPDYRVAPLVMDALPQAELDRLAAHPQFAQAARRTMAAWVPPQGDQRALGRLLRDLGAFMAAIWAVQLDAEPDGLTRASLLGVMADWGMAGPGRVDALLVYLQLVKLIQADRSGQGPAKRYRPTAQLRQLFHDRFRRELTHCLPVLPEVARVLDRWDDPQVFEGFMVAHGRLALAMQQSMDRAPTNLTAFSHRKSGITILSQLMLASDPAQGFPPTGPVAPNISELSRISGASRQQVLSVIRVGKEKGFMREDGAGLIHFSADLPGHISAFVRIYWLHMAWSGREALRWAASSAGRAD